MVAEWQVAGQWWTRFYLEHRRSFTSYAIALVGNVADAQDLLQEVLLRLIGLPQSDVVTRAYVLRCLRNLAIDRLRASAARPVIEALPVDAAAVIDQEVGPAPMRERAERVRAALHRLPREYHEVLVLKVYAGLTLREIAEVLQLPAGTVASHHRRGLAELRELYGEALDHVP